MPPAAAPFFIVLNAGSGHTDRDDRRATIESVLRGAGRECIGLYPKLLEERELDKKQFGRSRLVAALSALKTILSPHRRLRLALEVDGKLYRLRTATFFVGNNRLQTEQIGIAPLSAALEDGRLAAAAPRSKGKLGMLWLLLHGALGQTGRLDEADQLATCSFKQLQVRVRTLARRRRIKVATDGEVTRMTTPLAFRVLEHPLLLLKPDPGA